MAFEDFKLHSDLSDNSSRLSKNKGLIQGSQIPECHTKGVYVFAEKTMKTLHKFDNNESSSIRSNKKVQDQTEGKEDQSLSGLESPAATQSTSLSSQNGHNRNLLFEEKISIITDDAVRSGNKEFLYSHDEVLDKQDGRSATETTNDDLKELNDPAFSKIKLESRPNSMDELVSQIYDCEGQLENAKTEISDKKLLHKELNVCQNLPKLIIPIIMLMILLSILIILTSLPIFTCVDPNGLCVPQLEIQLVDKSPAAKATFLTVKEALKVLSYLALDFGGDNRHSDLLNSSLDSYYESKIIDTFNVNTVYKLNFLGYCRQSANNVDLFCMRSYGFDLIQVFARDTGAQLGKLTNTNIDIMGDSFAIAYELVIAGMSEMDIFGEEATEYVKYAILLQKFSRSLGLLNLTNFIINVILLTNLVLILTILLSKIQKKSHKDCLQHMKRYIFIMMMSLQFIGLVIGFLICSLTLEFFVKIHKLGSSLGIAIVSAGKGYFFIWCVFALQLLSSGILIYLLNHVRKDNL
ncbi:hypothetical protein WICMUC_002807 [Wickerhamomyces mucosus]|uniref:Uncharacterized protein n=1 Tax=Wickerhamomyces mucosus TaxID=1378264 RepID=A0A9P8TDI3_9ASCO|nr:hypothetical protein WICMUC_002807 [Wickerhamomyces mucosus]